MRIAREIEFGSRSDATFNMHLAEERGIEVDDSGVSVGVIANGRVWAESVADSLCAAWHASKVCCTASLSAWHWLLLQWQHLQFLFL